MVKQLADLKAYNVDVSAPLWLRYIAKLSIGESGVAALLGPSGVSVSECDTEPHRCPLDPMDIYLAGLASFLRQSGQRVSLGLPSVARHLPLLLAVASILDRVVDRSLGIDNNKGRSRGVLIVSADLDTRSKYCDLYVASESLDEAYPGSRMRPSGELVSLPKSCSQSSGRGVCFFLPHGNLPTEIDARPELVILDLRNGRLTNRASEMANWAVTIAKSAGVLALYSVGDRLTESALTNEGFINIPIDHAAIASSINYIARVDKTDTETALDWSTTDAIKHLTRNHIVIPVHDGDSVESTIREIGLLLDEQRESNNLDIYRSRWLLAQIRQLSVPIIWYEMTAQNMGRFTLRSMISHLGSRSRGMENLGPVMQTLRMHFEKIYNLLENANPKAETLRQVIKNHYSHHTKQPLLFLARDRINQRALEAWIGVELCPPDEWLDTVEIRGCNDYAPISMHQYASAIITGIFPKRYQWIAGSALGSNVTFLAYTHEIDVIESQLKAFYGESGILFRARTRTHSLGKLLSCKIEDLNVPESLIPEFKFDRPKAKLHDPQPEEKHKLSTVSGGLKELKKAFDAIQEVVNEKAEETSEQVTISHWQIDEVENDVPDHSFDISEFESWENDVYDLECIRVEGLSSIYGTGYLWLALDAVYECARPSKPDDILYLTPKQLQPGDVLPRMDIGGRMSLFDKIIDLAEEQPNMRYLKSFRQAWQEALRLMTAKFMDRQKIDYLKMLNALRQEGATIYSEMAVRCWVSGKVIGPEAVESIVAVGRVSGSRKLVNHANDFDRAFREIRGIHQGIGRRLTSAINKSLHHFVVDDSTDELSKYFDERIGVPLEELLDSMEFVEVTRVGSFTELKPSYIIEKFINY